ncbi:hypothetical protein HBI79_047080 [Parastagonospora nodorum]|nr:hypothetical protein HBI79_047080 [Parastagonospora nodorum]
MSTPLETSAMDVDGSSNRGRSSPSSIRSDSSQISYTDDYKTLPSSGPDSHAHIIDLSYYAELAKENGMIKLQDAIVTTLFSASPETLASFLSPTVNTFKAVFGKKDVQLVIWRKGLEVFVGTYENHTSMKSFRFEHVAGFLIGYDGAWHLKVTASNAYSSSKWPDVWAGKFEDRGGVAKMTVEVEEAAMAGRASTLAEYMLNTKYWELKADIKLT